MLSTQRIAPADESYDVDDDIHGLCRPCGSGGSGSGSGGSSSGRGGVVVTCADEACISREPGQAFTADTKAVMTLLKHTDNLRKVVGAVGEISSLADEVTRHVKGLIGFTRAIARPTAL